MANPLRGELEFVHAGQKYVLLLDVNALCMAEALLGLKSHEITQSIVAGGHMSALRGVLWAGLKEHHDLSLDEAGRLLQALSVATATQKMVAAIKLSFPPPKAPKDRPRTAARGTGSNSTDAG